MFETFVYTKDNTKIAINHYKNGYDDVVIICPGWFMTKDSKAFRTLAQDFSERYDVIVMDFRGHGKSAGFYTFTAKELFDLYAVVSYAKNPELGYKKIYLCGFSLGGALVLNYSANYDDIDKVIAVSAPSDFMKIENNMYLPDAWVPTLFKKFELARWMSIRAGSPFLKKERPIDFISDVKVPVLFVAGEKDPTVYPWHTELLYKNAKCPKKYVLFKNARHAEDLHMDFKNDFMQMCFDWLG